MSVMTVVVTYLLIGVIWYFLKVTQMKNHAGNPNPWEMKMEEERIKYSVLTKDTNLDVNSSSFENMIIGIESIICAFLWPLGAVNDFTNGY